MSDVSAIDDLVENTRASSPMDYDQTTVCEKIVGHVDPARHAVSM
jgi:hypothetical protein